MAQLTAGSAGKVVALQGKAVARTPGGGVRLLQVGDWVSQDDVIVTAQNGFVQLTSGGSPSAPAPASQVVAPPADAPSQLLRGQTLSDSAGGSLQTAFRAETLAEASPFPRLPALGREALSPLALATTQHQRAHLKRPPRPHRPRPAAEHPGGHPTGHPPERARRRRQPVTLPGGQGAHRRGDEQARWHTHRGWCRAAAGRSPAAGVQPGPRFPRQPGCAAVPRAGQRGPCVGGGQRGHRGGRGQ